MTKITFYTPTYKRPKALAICMRSVNMQTDMNFEQVIIHDDVGLGIGGMYQDIRNHLHSVHGDYVHVLSDDDVLTDIDAVRKIRRFIAAEDNPPVVIIKSEKLGRILPDYWQAAPQFGHIDLGNFVVRADVWKANATAWGDCYEGDFHFINALWQQGHRFAWLDDVLTAAQRISRGQPE